MRGWPRILLKYFDKIYPHFFTIDESALKRRIAGIPGERNGEESFMVMKKRFLTRSIGFEMTVQVNLYKSIKFAF